MTSSVPRSMLALAAASASAVACWEFEYSPPDSALGTMSARVDGEWSLLRDGPAAEAAKRFYEEKMDLTLPTVRDEATGECPPSDACHLWIDDVPDPAHWQRVPYGTSPAPSTYDLVIYAPDEGGRTHVAMVDHAENGAIYVMDSDAQGDGRRSEQPHVYPGEPMGWYHPGDFRRRDAGKVDAAAGAPTGCTPNGLYCGGHGVEGAPDTLYRCNADRKSAAVVAKCANGCVVLGKGGSDVCNEPTPCYPGGSYCGGDKINGDPDVLYRCVDGGPPVVITRCANGCEVRPGRDDLCR